MLRRNSWEDEVLYYHYYSNSFQIMAGFNLKSQQKSCPLKRAQQLVKRRSQGEQHRVNASLKPLAVADKWHPGSLQNIPFIMSFAQRGRRARLNCFQCIAET